MSFFDSWARRMAAGDWLCRNVDPPVHDWHRRFADEYYRRHPDELREVREAARPGGPDVDPARVLWGRWAGGRRFYQGPLYPYLVALTYKVCADVRCVFVWQLAAGVLVNVLVYLIARRMMGDLAGALSGAMACLYSPLLHMELVLVRETLIVLAALAMVYLADVAARRKAFRWWLLAGAVMGVSLMLKAHFALFVVAAAGLLVVGYRADRRALARAAAGLAAGVVLGLGPMVARNVAVGVSPLATATSARPAFALWNAYDPDVPPLKWHVLAAARIMDQAGGYGSVVLPTLRTHPRPSTYVELLRRKFDAAWHWYERPDSANLYYYQLHSPVLRYMPLTFFALGPLGIVGMLLAARRPGRCRYLYLQVFTNLAAMVLFFPVGRFRLPMAAAMIPFGALTVVQVVKWAAERKKLKVLATVCVVAGLWLWTGRPLPRHVSRIRAADYLVPYPVYYTPMINEAAKAGKWQRAADLLAESLRYEPASVRRMGRGYLPETPDELRLANYYATLKDYYAGLLLRAGHERAAAAEKRRAAEIRGAVRRAAPADRNRAGQRPG